MTNFTEGIFIRVPDSHPNIWIKHAGLLLLDNTIVMMDLLMLHDALIIITMLVTAATK